MGTDALKWIITKSRQDINQMTIGLWMELLEYPNRYDINRDVISWEIPQSDYNWMILRYPELNKEMK
jgi:hypothetical protein